MRRESFGEYHPVTCFLFFLIAICLGMCLIHPLFSMVSFLCAAIYLFVIKGRTAIKELIFSLILVAVISFVNPLFQTAGRHVLFHYLGGRVYTMEALLYGFALGSMAACVLLWFSCYNAVMSSEKFIFLFGKLVPSLSLILSMILRLIPRFEKKARQMNDARAAIGMAGSASGNQMEKLRNGATILGALTNWGLEGGILSADSMRARGYGTGQRTGYAKYKFDGRNIVLLVVLFLLSGGIIVCLAIGAASASYIPEFTIAWIGNPATGIGLLLYVCFLLIPVFLNLKEWIVWRILRSKI